MPTAVATGSKPVARRAYCVSTAVSSTVKFVIGDNGGRPEDAVGMFGHLSYDPKIRTLWVANSARGSLFAIRVAYESFPPNDPATRLGAQAAGLDDRVGTLEAGRWADLIVVEGDVLEAPATVVRPSWVILNGEIVRRPTESATDSTTSFAPN